MNPTTKPGPTAGPWAIRGDTPHTIRREGRSIGTMAEAADAALAVHDHNAAPELEAALGALLDAYIDETARANNGVPIMSARISQARAALAKAKGTKG